MTSRRIFVPPVDPEAEPICTLDRETALRRKEQPDRLLDQALEQTSTGDGIEYRFGPVVGLWERIETFIKEEGQCCRFLAFELTESQDAVVLKAFQPGFATQDT